MPHFIIPLHRSDDTHTTRDLAVDFEQADDNLFLTVDGARTGISLWFEFSAAGHVLISLGRVPEDGDWWDYENTIPVPDWKEVL